MRNGTAKAPTRISSFELSERHAAEAASTTIQERPDRPRQGFLAPA